MSLRQIIFRLALELGARTHCLLPVVKVLEGAIVQVLPKAGTRMAKTPIRILALNPDRFRGDLEVLANSGEVCVYRFPFVWQSRFLAAYFSEDVSLSEHANPAVGSRTWRAKRNFSRVLVPIFRQLAKRQRFDVVVGAAVHYLQDMHLGAAANQAGLPYVVFHRENFMASPSLLEGAMTRLTEMGRFGGSQIIVHNDHAREAFVQSGFVAPEQCRALGALRMGQFLDQLEQPQMKPKGERPLVVFFSFTHGVGQIGHRIHWSDISGRRGFVRLFDSVYVALATLAARRPDIDIVVKPKWGGDFVQRIEAALLRSNIDRSTLPNLRIDTAIGAQHLIMNADVVSAFNSTTMLEAAVAGKPVVVPLFDEAAQEDHADLISLKGELSAVFDTARSAADYLDLIEQRLLHWSPSVELMERRKALFDEWVAPLGRKASEQYIHALELARDRGSPSATPGSNQRAG